MTALLEVRSLTRKFGQLTAVNDASFSVGAGEIWGFIGTHAYPGILAFESPRASAD